MESMDEFKQIFFTECAELLSDMEERVMKLEEGTSDRDALNAIFRCAHSIKGGSGAFGYDNIMHFTHAMEALLDGMREGRIIPSRASIDLLLKSSDIVTRMLDARREETTLAAGFGSEVLTALLEQTTQNANRPVSTTPNHRETDTSGTHSYTIQFAPNAELFTTGNDPLHILRELKKIGEAEITIDSTRLPLLAEIDPTLCYCSWTVTLTTTASEDTINEVFEFVRDIAQVSITAQLVAAMAPHTTEPTAAPEKKAAAEEGAGKSTATSIRVDLEKVDRLVNMVGELVITEAMLRAQVRQLTEDKFSGLLQGVDELSHHTRELQEAVMAVRMQPVKSVFSRMPRIVRDTSAQLGKNIQLILSGENTEVDKTVIELLGDPLTHMIRNSVDHGIETPDQRVWNDKPEQGTIRLSAYHRSGRIMIEIADDGAGINRGRVLDKAKEKGLVGEGVTLSDEEIDHLIFLPGFSTAEKVTSVSGRGVGMDVVKRNIENLGGTVRITNLPGKGSTFTVSLPLTLAILDGMIVRVGTENYIIPITSITETLRPKAEQVNRLEGRNDVLNVRGDFLPLIYLNDLFQIPGAADNPSEALVVLVESGMVKMGLVVDELIGQQQVVIKSLEANADPVKGISGATILGDGKVSLILEINELRQLCLEQVPATAFKLAA
jgi:two-component system chemotaxis sensor kinase CheA